VVHAFAHALEREQRQAAAAVDPAL
jgi:hypothetical protein